jgi:hypothetical protein
MMHPSEKEVTYDKKRDFYMSDRNCSYFRRSKHPGSGVPVSGLDDLYVQSADAVWNAGDRIYRRLVIDIAETQK